jgi:SpoVK/Ycf46/Vps4 family AAA+-type ATPase
LVQDEIDSLGQTRGANDDASSRRLLTELLLQMTGIQNEDGIYIFAATNRIQVRL